MIRGQADDVHRLVASLPHKPVDIFPVSVNNLFLGGAGTEVRISMPAFKAYADQAQLFRDGIVIGTDELRPPRLGIGKYLQFAHGWSPAVLE